MLKFATTTLPTEGRMPQSITAAIPVKANLNTGPWTPTLTFGTPGDLSIIYSTRIGHFYRTGDFVQCHFHIRTSNFTHTTSVGGARITGLPFVQANDPTNSFSFGDGYLALFQGIIKNNYTQFTLVGQPVTSIPGDDGKYFNIKASGSGQAMGAVEESNMPSGSTVILLGRFSYIAT
jgi:hypothetical protein